MVLIWVGKITGVTFFENHKELLEFFGQRK